MPDESIRGAGGTRRKPRSTRRKALLITVWTLVGVLLLGGAGAAMLYVKLNGNLTAVDVDAILGPDRPEDPENGSTDILVLGSDSRAGENSSYGGAGQSGARSDTAMIVHLYEGRKKASIVSIPRDTLVDRPSCVKDDGKRAPAARKAMFNESYSVGGPSCAIKTVESMTGIRMDHFLEVDFSGFKKLIDELGGVEVTTTKPIDDKDSHLKLEAGTHKLDGEQSLALVRTRKGIGDGSDLGRIKLQQTFVRALVDQVDSVGLVSDPAKLYRLADTATRSITTDEDLASVGELNKLAMSMRGISSHDIQMATLPVTFDREDANRVVPLDKQADRVWAALKADRGIPKSALKGAGGPEAADNKVLASP